MTARADMEAVLEAILFVSNDPVSRDKLLEVFDQRERAEAADALQAVVERYRERPDCGLLLDEAAGGLRLVSRPDLHGYLRRFFEVSGSNKLSMPALETLAIVAYRQPVTGPEIAELRGVSSQGVLKTLLERRLIRVSGRKEVVGKPFLYATTREFLMHFGLRSLKELPPLEQFEELFAGDSEAAAEGGPPDAEEIADREAADLEQAAEDAAAQEEQEADERQQEEAEAAELPLDAEPPPTKTEEPPTADTEEPDPEGESSDPESSDAGADSKSSENDPAETDGADPTPESTTPAAEADRTGVDEIPRADRPSGDEGQDHES